MYMATYLIHCKGFFISVRRKEGVKPSAQKRRLMPAVVKHLCLQCRLYLSNDCLSLPADCGAQVSFQGCIFRKLLEEDEVIFISCFIRFKHSDNYIYNVL